MIQVSTCLVALGLCRGEYFAKPHNDRTMYKNIKNVYAGFYFFLLLYFRWFELAEKGKKKKKKYRIEGEQRTEGNFCVQLSSGYNFTSRFNLSIWHPYTCSTLIPKFLRQFFIFPIFYYRVIKKCKKICK